MSTIINKERQKIRVQAVLDKVRKDYEEATVEEKRKFSKFIYMVQCNAIIEALHVIGEENIPQTKLDNLMDLYNRRIGLLENVYDDIEESTDRDIEGNLREEWFFVQIMAKDPREMKTAEPMIHCISQQIWYGSESEVKERLWKKIDSGSKTYFKTWEGGTDDIDDIDFDEQTRTFAGYNDYEDKEVEYRLMSVRKMKGINK